MSESPESSRSEEPVPSRLHQRVAIYDPNDEWTEDDDDMDFEPAEESAEEGLGEGLGESDLDEIEYYDASEDQGSGVEIEFELTDDSREGTEDPSEGNEDEGEQTETEQARTEGAQPTIGTRQVTITQQQILQLLGHAGLRGLFANHGGGRATIRRAAAADEEDDEDDDEGTPFGYGSWGRRIRRSKPREPFQFPPVPHPEGRKLMESGNFGLNERRTDTYARKKKLAHRTMMRELGLGSPGHERSNNKLISHNMIPSSKADTIINYNNRCYSGQFSDDGNFFFSCAQDFRVRMYDTSNPYKWKYYKTAHYIGGQWTITDASLTPDNKYLAYSSIRPEVMLAPTDPDNTADPYTLDFANSSRAGRRSQYGSRFGVWSIRFSGDGREIVAGTSDHSIYVYDLETSQSILRIPGHDDDVNAVCYGDKSSPHILFSGSDDTTLKVWDRRSLGDGREAGVFMGHTEGLTYIDSKGDGRYVISNGKDQTMKLWDLRKMIPPDKAEKINPQEYSAGFDYRFAPYDEADRQANPHDCSLVTFRGHKVLKTLIRCHFSPPGSTDGRYVYSGSHDGSVYIWNLDATLKAKINVLEATMNSRPIEDERYVDRWDMSGRGQWSTIVRDVSWHPNAPVIAATSWNGWDHGLGTCTVHSWNDDMDDDEAEPKMGARVTGQLEHDDRYYRGTGDSTRGRPSQFRRDRLRNRQGLFTGDDDDE